MVIRVVKKGRIRMVTRVVRLVWLSGWLKRGGLGWLPAWSV